MFNRDSHSDLNSIQYKSLNCNITNPAEHSQGIACESVFP